MQRTGRSCGYQPEHSLPQRRAAAPAPRGEQASAGPWVQGCGVGPAGQLGGAPLAGEARAPGAPGVAHMRGSCPGGPSHTHPGCALRLHPWEPLSPWLADSWP